MDFTREPIVESVITPKEGFKLVIRSSKNTTQEEFFVDSVEVVSFGGNFFFLRSLERPKSFLVPAMDYEVLEVRETRMVLKTVGMDRTIKIGGGKPPKKVEASPSKDEETEIPEKEDAKNARLEKRRERRRQGRKRREKDEPQLTAESSETSAPEAEKQEQVVQPRPTRILPPPSRLISETIERYKEDSAFQGMFVSETEKDRSNSADDVEEDNIDVKEEGTVEHPLESDADQVSYEDPLFSDEDTDDSKDLDDADKVLEGNESPDSQKPLESEETTESTHSAENSEEAEASEVEKE
ncbi:MAG: hypothetical protein WD595_02430 [Waddliaceae bacterium]